MQTPEITVTRTVQVVAETDEHCITTDETLPKTYVRICDRDDDGDDDISIVVPISLLVAWVDAYREATADAPAPTLQDPGQSKASKPVTRWPNLPEGWTVGKNKITRGRECIQLLGDMVRFTDQDGDIATIPLDVVRAYMYGYPAPTGWERRIGGSVRQLGDQSYGIIPGMVTAGRNPGTYFAEDALHAFVAAIDAR